MIPTPMPRILVIDASLDTRTIIATALQRQRYHVMRFDGPIAALRYLYGPNVQSPHIVFLDFFPPKSSHVSGPGVVKAIKRRHPDTVVVALLPPQSYPFDRIMARLSGAIYLIKPFTTTDLLHLVLKYSSYN